MAIPPEWECVGYSEVEPRAIEIYEQHFKHKNFGDITKIEPESLPDFDILVGGFPCQSFSIAGNRRGFDDTRGTLFFDIARIIKVKKPKMLLLENVKGLLSHDRGRTFETILRTLDELGYDAEWGVLDGYNFNSTARQRVFVLAYNREYEDADGEREIEALPLYSCIGEGVRDKDERHFEESVRDTRRIIRTFAGLPDWLDSWDTIYGAESEAGERRATESSKSNN